VEDAVACLDEVTSAAKSRMRRVPLPITVARAIKATLEGYGGRGGTRV